MTIPDWLKAELVAHPSIEVRWIDYGPRKVFVLPLVGDAFYRMPVRKLNTILYRRYITAGSPLKWKLHPLTYIPDPECVTDGRWVVFQTEKDTGAIWKLFDVVHDDGSFHPLDRRVLEAIQRRDGVKDAHEKAIKDVEEVVPEAAEKSAYEDYENKSYDLFGQIYHDVKRVAVDHACIEPDPTEDDIAPVSM